MILSSTHYTTFLSLSIKVFLNILGEGEPYFIAQYNIQQVCTDGLGLAPDAIISLFAGQKADSWNSLPTSHKWAFEEIWTSHSELDVKVTGNWQRIQRFSVLKDYNRDAQNL